MSFALLLFVGIILFFSINQSFVEETQYILLVLSTILYITVPTLMHLFLSAKSSSPALLEEMNKETNRYRWLEFFFSSSIMVLTLGILIGITSSLELSILAGMNAIMILFGAFADLAKQTWQKIVFFGVSGAVFTTIWLILIRRYIEITGGGVSSALSDGTFSQLMLILVLFCTFPLFFLIQHFSGLKIRYTTIDKLYILAGFVTKASLFMITLIRL